MRHATEVLIPGFKKPILQRNAIPRPQGMALCIRRNFPASHKDNFRCRCHEVKVVKVVAKPINFAFCIYWNPHADASIFDCLLTSMTAVQDSDRKAAFLLEILMHTTGSG